MLQIARVLFRSHESGVRINGFNTVFRSEILFFVKRASPVKYAWLPLLFVKCGDCVKSLENKYQGNYQKENVIPGQDLSVNLQTMLVYLGHYGHLSYEKQQKWLIEFGKIEVSWGTLVATTLRVSEALSPQVQELKD